jgi:hypothetical protein
MSIKRITILIVVFMLLISCTPPKKEATPTDDTQQQVDDAIQETNDVETQVAQALTQTALVNQPEPTNTPLPFTDVPAFTITPIFTLTPTLTAISTEPAATSTNSAPPTATTCAQKFSLTNCNDNPSAGSTKTITFQISQPTGFYTEMTVYPGKCETLRLCAGDYNYKELPCGKTGVFRMDHNVQWYWVCK